MNNFLNTCLVVFIYFNSLSAFAIDETNGTYEKALISFQRNDIQTSLIHLRNVLQMDENHMPARLLLARSYLELGDGLAAELALQKTNPAQVDSNQVITLYAHAHLLQKHFDKVLELTEPDLHQGMVEHDLQVFRGQAYIGLKQYRSADYAFKQALLIKPNSPLAWLGRAQIALGDIKPKLALSFIEQAISNDDSFVNGWIFKAKILQQMRLVDDALLAINKALVIDEAHMSARLTKAMLLMNNHSYEEAQKHVDYILNIIPNEPRAGYLKAVILASYNNVEGQESDKILSEVILTLSAVPEDIMRNTPDYYYLAGQANYQFGNLADARRYLIKFLKYSEYEVNSVLMVASIDLQQNEPESARSLLMKANIAKPKDVRILTLLGLAYLQLNNTIKAEFYFENVLTMNPNSVHGLTNFARSKMQSGKYQSAIKTLLSIEDKNINPVQIKLLLIDSYQQSNQINKAIVVAKELLTEFPEDSFFYQRIGSLYGLNNELELARSYFKRALELDENNILAIVHLARMDNIAGESVHSLQFLQEKLQKFPQNTLIMAEISDAYLISQDVDKALIWIKKAYAQEVDNFYIVKKFTSILMSIKNTKEALEIISQYVDRNRKDLTALELLATLYAKNNQKNKALGILADLVKKSENKALAYMKLAKAQRLTNNTTGAIQSYKKSIIADDTNIDAYLALVNMIIKQQDEVYADILILNIEKLSGDKALVEQLKGTLAFELQKFKQAEAHFLASITIEERKPALIGLYNTYKKLKKVDSAIPYLLHYISSNPDELQVKISLADSYRYSHKLQKSFDLYKKMLDKFGQIPILLNNIANVSYDLGKKQQAKAYAEQAYSHLSHNVAIIDTLAWIEARLGNNERALGLLRKALTKDYDNAEVKYHIAVTLYSLSRDKEALQFLIESVESEQEFNEKQAAKLLLAKK